MVQVDPKVLQAAIADAERCAPREACGLVISVGKKPVYVPCHNTAGGEVEFAIDPVDYAAAEDRGEVLMVVHSHYGIPPDPSHADLVGCERSQLPWLIVNWPVGSYRVVEPSGYVAPLKSRQFCHGVLDCFALVRDYYKQVLDVELADPVREDLWWKKGQNLYLDNAEAWGFTRVDSADLREHDVILMQAQSDVPNHAAIYLGNSRILQHLRGRLSGEDVYGGYWVKQTYGVYRHRSQM
jgi:proteasome lid subunit RPN8/RPN11